MTDKIVWFGLGSILFVLKMLGWDGLGSVVKKVGWVGLGPTNWTHGHLWVTVKA